MIPRRIDRVLIAARGGEGIALLKAVEATGREGVLLMRTEDAHQAWIDEVTYVVHVPADADGRWPDWNSVASAALDAGCDALLPGCGALAAHAGLSERLASMNVIELGPGTASLALAADIVRFLDLGRVSSLRTVPALDLPSESARALAEAEAWLERWGLPAWIRVRRADGGVETTRLAAIESARERVAEALARGQVALVHNPPHARVIEVPVAGDGKGDVVTLGDREVTLARNGEGVLIEAPAADLPSSVRAVLQEESARLMRELRWRGVGSVAFAVTADGRPFLRELRPGLAPWHAVTEAAYGVDLVDLLIGLAEGEPLRWSQAEIVPGGAALGLRIFAEAAAPLPEHVVPAVGPRPDEEQDLDEDEPSGVPVAWVQTPEDVRVDLALTAGDRVVVGEDLGMVVVSAPTRQASIVRAKSATDHLELGGVVHTGAVLAEVLSDTAYWRGPAGLDL